MTTVPCNGSALFSGSTVNCCTLIRIHRNSACNGASAATYDYSALAVINSILGLGGALAIFFKSFIYFDGSEIKDRASRAERQRVSADVDKAQAVCEQIRVLPLESCCSRFPDPLRWRVLVAPSASKAPRPGNVVSVTYITTSTPGSQGPREPPR